MSLMSINAWQEAGAYFQFQEKSIFYRTGGSGAALLLLHGFPTASWDWYKVWDELASRFTVIAPDLLGFGYSDKPADIDYRIHLQADLVEALLAELNFSRCHVLAHDYGDTVAQELLARSVEREAEGGDFIRSLCFLNGGLFPETHRPRFIQKLLLSPLGPLISRMLTEAKFRSSFSAIFGPETQPNEAELRSFWKLISYNDGAAIAHKLIGYIRDREEHRERWVSAMQHSNAPLCLINGPGDPVSGRHMTERYRELISDPDIVLLDGIGHYPQVEAPAAMLKAYVAFVEAVG